MYHAVWKLFVQSSPSACRVTCAIVQWSCIYSEQTLLYLATVTHASQWAVQTYISFRQSASTPSCPSLYILLPSLRAGDAPQCRTTTGCLQRCATCSVALPTKKALIAPMSCFFMTCSQKQQPMSSLSMMEPFCGNCTTATWNHCKRGKAAVRQLPRCDPYHACSTLTAVYGGAQADMPHHCCSIQVGCSLNDHIPYRFGICSESDNLHLHPTC